MNTKLVLGVIALAVSSVAFAQKKEVKALEKAIKAGSYGEAKTLVVAAENLLGQMDNKTKEKFMLFKAQAYLGVGNKNMADLEKAAEAYKALEGTKYEQEGENGITNVVAALVESAVDDQNAERYSDAGQKLEKAYNYNNENKDYYYFAASNYLNSKEYDNAARIFEELIEMEYTGQQTQYYAVAASTGEEKLFSSEQERRIAVLSKEYITPSERLSESRQGVINEYLMGIYSFKGENEKALELIDTALEKKPNDTKLMTSKANIYLKLDKKDEYRAIVEKILESDPNNAELHYNLGVTSDNQGDLESAKKYYRTAIELDPTYANAYNNLGAMMIKEDAKFIDSMNSLGVSNADMAKYDVLKAQRMENLKGASTYYEKVFELKPTNTVVAKTLLNIYQVLENNDKVDALKVKIEALEDGNE